MPAARNARCEAINRPAEVVSSSGRHPLGDVVLVQQSGFSGAVQVTVEHTVQEWLSEPERVACYVDVDKTGVVHQAWQLRSDPARPDAVA